MKKLKQHLLAAIITLLVAAVGFYVFLPAINIHNSELLLHITLLAIIYRSLLWIAARNEPKVINLNKGIWKKSDKATKVTVIIVGVCILVGVVGSLSGAVIFNAAKYRQLLTVEEGDFTEDVKEISYSQIPTLDYVSATKLGDRKMGELSDMVSQFSVLDNYTQINYKGTPTRVTPLGYADLFKWLTNHGEGIPAYISIDMVSQEVTVNRLEQGMRYTESDMFGRNIYRYLRFKYPTYMFTELAFEVDENGTPFWVCPRVDFSIGLYGGKDIVGTVLVNAVTGEHTYYDIGDVPSWVDRAFDADLIIEQYDYYGTLQNGYWNSIFGQKGCKQTTDGYNYIAIGDDVYMYTGVTSLAADESNVGFILTNQRTKKTKFYSIPGAEEYSAMSSAEGEVQNLRYSSTFPLLLNVSGEPTYFVALKDDAGLVKMYAFVNVRQYQIVGKGTTLQQCEADYTAKLKSNGITEVPEDTAQTLELTAAITEIRSAVVNGNTHLYFSLTDSDKVFVCSVADFAETITYNVGDTVTVFYKQSESMLVTVTNIQKNK